MAAQNSKEQRYRSGAVARMLRMPVATLRIWQQRYQVAAPDTTAAGHRLYSAADVQRLALMKQLTGLGHAIGELASLDMAQLQRVAQTHAGVLAGSRKRLAGIGALHARPAPPRRYDDASLADFAGLSSTVACECPRHLAELLMQLSNFEAYSADCQQRSPADAELHAYLHRLAGTTRAMFEAALEQVALHEGLLLPGDQLR